MFKIVGAICVIVGCGAVGFRIAAAYRLEEKALRQLLHTLEYMENELAYRLTSLPQLCRQAAEGRSGPVRQFFLSLSNELEMQLSPDVSRCMTVCLNKQKDIPPITQKMIQTLGDTLGRFELEGQLNGIHSVKLETGQQLDMLCKNKETRIRNYQTLGLCAGVALAILFI